MLVDPLLGSATLRGLLLATGSQAPTEVPADLARAVVDSVQHCPGYERVLAALSRHRFERADDIDLDLPVTVVWGDHDRILTPVHQSRELVPPQTRWVVLPRCGHAPMWDAPEAVVRARRADLGTGPLEKPCRSRASRERSATALVAETARPAAGHASA